MVRAVLLHVQNPLSLADIRTVLLRALSQGQFAVGAQLQLHLYKTAQQSGQDEAAAFAPLSGAAAAFMPGGMLYYGGVEPTCRLGRSAASLALLKGWAAVTASLDAAQQA
jgi:hypothetical protein